MEQSDRHFEESTLCQQHQGGDHVFAVGNLVEKKIKEETVVRLLKMKCNNHF